MNKRRILGLAMVVALVGGLVVAGCAAPAPPPAPAPAPAPAPPAPAPAPPAPAPAPPPPVPGPPAEVTEWIFMPCYGPGVAACWYGHLMTWVELVEEATEGTVKIEVLPVGSIAGYEESLPATRERMTDIWSGWATVYGGIVPEGFLAYGLAHSAQTPAQAWEALWGPEYRIGDIVKAGAERTGLYWGGWSIAHDNQAFTTFPVHKWEDFKGHKMRAGGPQSVYYAALGGMPVAMAWGDIYMATKLGTIEGFFADMTSVAPDKLHEVIDYAIYPCWNPVQSEEIFINLDSWNALTDWQRDAIDGIFELHYWKATAIMYEYRDESKDACAAAGVEFIHLSDEEVARITKRVVDEVWPKVAEKSPELARGVEIYKQFLKDEGLL